MDMKWEITNLKQRMAEEERAGWQNRELINELKERMAKAEEYLRLKAKEASTAPFELVADTVAEQEIERKFKPEINKPFYANECVDCGKPYTHHDGYKCPKVNEDAIRKDERTAIRKKICDIPTWRSNDLLKYASIIDEILYDILPPVEDK